MYQWLLDFALIMVMYWRILREMNNVYCTRTRYNVVVKVSISIIEVKSCTAGTCVYVDPQEDELKKTMTPKHNRKQILSVHFEDSRRPPNNTHSASRGCLCTCPNRYCDYWKSILIKCCISDEVTFRYARAFHS